MKVNWTATDRLGILKPIVYAHVLGISAVEQLLNDCGCSVEIGDRILSEASNRPFDPSSADAVDRWIRSKRLSRIGFSYRLDASDAQELFSGLLHMLNSRKLFVKQGGPLRAVYFAGLPDACSRVKDRYPEVSAVFHGDETVFETLEKLGIRSSILPAETAKNLAYDEDRLSFGRELIQKADYLAVKPPNHGGYPSFGGREDTVVERLAHARRASSLPLIRAHSGPYISDREEAVRLFLQWTADLASAGYLDVLSIGTSQLTQSRFMEEWGDSPNGGGVPLNSQEEFASVWRSARPMLVRTYAGSKNICDLARMYEDTIHNAWHALSLWWFCKIDNRGPYALRENLLHQCETLRYVASVGKPFEPNIPHHFAFRGCDDATYVLSACLAAKTAKAVGIRYLILQNMLNTPKSIWGIQDLAKSRAMLRLVRSLTDRNFKVFFQTRGGLEDFSPDPFKAKAQLAATTALMDDVEPNDALSPHIIHVVSYSEATHLAEPSNINESVQITLKALEEYRNLRKRGLVDDMSANEELNSRTDELQSEVVTVLEAIEKMVPEVYSPEGLYRIFAAGFLPVPHLWECRDEFPAAVSWKTRSLHGSVRLVDELGKNLSVAERLNRISPIMA